jgi:hypothetical protein
MDAVRCASNHHVGIFGDVLAHLVFSVGNVIGLVIRLGHGDVGRSGPTPSVDVATPIHGITAVGLRR